MTRDEIVQLFAGLRVWTRGDERAPHKPLLLLYALARVARGEPREMPFTVVDVELTRLLREFGPVRKSYHPEYPFWRLQNDDLWVVRDADKVTPRASNTDARKSDLLRFDIHGGFPPEVYAVLRADRRLVSEVARMLLAGSFPESLHDDICSAVGLSLVEETVELRRRDPAFRQRVLRAYAYRCAVCGFAVRLGDMQVGLEAAHIRWHQAGGPDDEPNGLALCVLHHKLFDLGAFTVGRELAVELSASLHGDAGFGEHFLAFHGQRIRRPADPGHLPAAVHLEWHWKQVFRGPSRFIGPGAP